MNQELLRETLVGLLPSWRELEISWSEASAGYMHKTHFAKSPSGTVVLKMIDEEMLAKFLRRDAASVIACTQIAGAAGIGPKVLAAGDDPACLVLEFLEGRGLEPADLGDEKVAEGVVERLRALHRLEPPAHPAEQFGRGQYWLEGITRVESPWAGRLGDLASPLSEIEAALARREVRTCFTHNDLYWENLYSSGDQLYFIDYDLAGAGDPAYDLGDFAAEHDLAPAAQEQACRVYYEREDERDLAVLRLTSVASNVIQGAGIAFAVARFPDRYEAVLSELDPWIGQKLDAADAGIGRDGFSADLKLASTAIP